MINNYRKNDDGTFVNMNLEEKKRFDSERMKALRLQKLEKKVEQLQKRLSLLEKNIQEQ